MQMPAPMQVSRAASTFHTGPSSLAYAFVRWAGDARGFKLSSIIAGLSSLALAGPKQSEGASTSIPISQPRKVWLNPVKKRKIH